MTDQSTGLVKHIGVEGIRITDYQIGRRHGLSVTWYANDMRSSMEKYYNGQLHGTQIYWYMTGIKEKQVAMVNGKKKGPYYHWDPAGNLIGYTVF